MTKCALAPGTIENAPGRRVDVDPDHVAVAHEFQAIGVAAEFRAKIVGAAHVRHDAALDLRQGHRTADPGRLERTILVPRPVGPGRRSGQAGGNSTAKKGTKQAHGESLERDCYAQGIEYPMNGPKSPVHPAR